MYQRLNTSRISRAECNGVVCIFGGVAGPEGRTAGFIISIGIRIRAGILEVAVELDAYYVMIRSEQHPRNETACTNQN